MHAATGTVIHHWHGTLHTTVLQLAHSSRGVIDLFDRLDENIVTVGAGQS